MHVSCKSRHSSLGAGTALISIYVVHVNFLYIQVTQMHLTGDWSAGKVKEGLELAMGGCQQLRAVVRQTLLEAALGQQDDGEGDGMVQ